MSNCIKRLSLLLFVIFSGAIIQPVQAQENQKLDSDRPSQGIPSAAVPRNHLQLEAGWQFQKDTRGDAEIKTNAYPTALLRYGLFNKVELRVQGAFKDSVTEDATRKSIKGFGPLGVGALVGLWEEKGLLPEAAFMIMITLPVGKEAFRPEDPEPQLRLSFTNKLTDKTDLNYNLVQGWTGGNKNTGYTVSLSNEVSEKLGVFAEVFGNKESGEKAEHQADAGILIRLLDNLQLDVAAGTQLNKAAPDYFVTAGLTARLPR